MLTQFLSICKLKSTIMEHLGDIYTQSCFFLLDRSKSHFTGIVKERPLAWMKNLKYRKHVCDWLQATLIYASCTGCIKKIYMFLLPVSVFPFSIE